MKSENKLETVIPALNIELALTGEICPYCGATHKQVKEHIKKCLEAGASRELGIQIDQNNRRAIHDSLGKVFVLAREDGLALVEGDHGRCVVPLATLNFGMLNRLIGEIEEYDLDHDEIDKLINILRIKAGGKIKIPPYPELWPGCRVEVQLGEFVRAVIIKKKVGSCYFCEIDGRDHNVNISPKDIIRIL